MIELIKVDIKALQQQQLHRKRWLLPKNCLNFSSNDYLSLNQLDVIKEAFQQGFKDYPTGSSGSMVVSGYHLIHQKLEQAFIEALGVEDALLFSSGYSANTAVMNLLSHHKAIACIDKEMHASVYDGVHSNQLNYFRYSHQNLAKLSDYLKKSPINPVLFSESIFSMSGNQASLNDLSTLAELYNTPCIIDEAHAFGVKGLQGMGAIEEAGLTDNEIPLRIIPFGKSLNFQGAIIAGQKDWIDGLLQRGRSYIYSTAISPAVAFGLIKTLAVVKKAHARRAQLNTLIHHFKENIEKDPHRWNNSTSAIQQLILGDAHTALTYSHFLAERGIFCIAMRPPSVPKMHTGLRIVLNAAHTVEDIDYLFSQLNDCYDALYSNPR